MNRGPRFPAWVWAFPVLGGLRLVAWFMSGGWDQTTPGLLIGLVLTVAYAGGGVLLIGGGRPQPGPTRLGGAFILVASAFVPGAPLAGTGALPMRVLAAVRPEYLLPAFLWGFAAVYPHRSPYRAATGLPNGVAWVTAVCGTIAFVTGFVAQVGLSWNAGSQLRWLDSAVWILIYVLNGAALLYVAAEARRARSNERRRVSLFITGILLGSAPAVGGSLVLLLFPPALEFLQSRPLALGAYRLVSYAGLAAIPVVTLYAVLESRVLGLRDVARSSIRTLLARQAAFLATVAPLLALGGVLVLQRRGVVQPATASFATVGSGLLALAGAVALLKRRSILAFVDEHFFPDEQRIDLALARLTTEIADAPSTAELAGLVRTGLETAMGLTRVSLLDVDPHRQDLRSPRNELRPLRLSPQLRSILEQGHAIRPQSRAHRWDAALLEWATESGMELVVPFRTGDVSGAIGAGVKSSGMAFTRDDEHRLLRIASNAGRRLAQVRRLQGEEDGRSGGPSGRDCTGCGAVNPAVLEHCARCGSSLQASALPYILAGKFRLVERLGSGAGGVVYAAVDLDLDRRVAVKTLAWSRATDATALHEEARVMARLSHPALATIFGLEMFEGTPVLVMELFDEGSLRDRLRREPLNWTQAFAMGASLARGLEYLHARELLHGDVKPSNVGITSAHDYKLLDFGLSRIVDRDTAGQEAGGGAGGDPRGVRGTAAYLPPESHESGRVGPAADIWGLAITVYEAIAGRHPYTNVEGRLPAGRILTGVVPDIRDVVVDCPDSVAHVFRTVLAADIDARPRTASQLAACFGVR